MNKEIRYRSLEVKSVKEDNERLIIEAYGAVFGNIDSYGDVIEKGAFQKTISERGDRIKFCFQHDIYNAVGKILELREDDYGLWVRVEMSAAEQDLSTKIKEGIYNELSIGYRTIEAARETRNGEDVLLLKEIMLYEVSIVSIAANPLAVITGMKSEEQRNHLEKEFDRLIAIVRNKNIEFDLLNLKSLALSLESKPKEEPKPAITANDVKQILGLE